MKKVITFLLVSLIAFSLTACGGNDDQEEKGIAIITSAAGANDNGYNESAIDGAKKVADFLVKNYTGPCVFDRNGYAYHGRVKEFADHARSLGLQF